ncbi:sulfate adenylyltransferase subunit 1 [Flagellimonas marinaquae]
MREEKDLLRFITAGSVDDGKSTLIGRLLYDSGRIMQEQLEAINDISKGKGYDYLDLSLVTDGLKSEREQGITIDVAYRFFETQKRKFIIADTPGHLEYTRNMVTGASTAQLAVILVDARKGVLQQTKRHIILASLLGISHILVCVNKMDLIDYGQKEFKAIELELLDFCDRLSFKEIHFIPISALTGMNIVHLSSEMPWYTGPSLLHYLEEVSVDYDAHQKPGRFPIQYVIRPHTMNHQDYRGFAGRMEGGVFRIGDRVKVLPSGQSTTIRGIELNGQQLEKAIPPQSVNILLSDDLNLSRGDLLVAESNPPKECFEATMLLTWMSSKPLILERKLWVKHTTNEVMAVITEINYVLDVNTMAPETKDTNISLNDIVSVTLRMATPLFLDTYEENRYTGSLILIDGQTNETLGAGVIVAPI